MKVGIRYPYDEMSQDPRSIRSFVQTAEALGFDFVACIDHVVGVEHAGRIPPLEGPYDERSLFREPFVLLAWIAGQTERLKLVTSVLVLPQRQTILVAKQAAELQALSEGRLRLGVGSGWNPVEYEAMGISYRRRGARLQEQVEVMRDLWNEQVVDFVGEFHRVDRASMLPSPPHQIPIWFGGISRAQLERCARYGDGFVFRKASRAAAEAIVNIRSLAAENGRDPDVLGFDVSAIDIDGDMTDSIHKWAIMGGSHVTLRPRGEDLLSCLQLASQRLDLEFPSWRA